MIFLHVFVLIEKHRYMIKIFRGRGGDTLKTPFPLQTAFAFTHPLFKTFLERSLNDLHPTTPLPLPPPKNFDRTLAGFDWTLWSQSIMGSPVIESTSSCPGHLSGVPTVLQSTSSCPKYLRLSRVPLVVESTSICREHLQLSKVPPAVESTSTAPVVESISSCPKYLHLSRAPPVVQSTSSCREHHQLKVSPLARSASSCPKCLQLSRGPPSVGSR